MREVLEEYLAWREAGEAVAVVTVVRTWGSSPRPLGSKMIVSGSGKMAGSVSNGCIEGAVFEAAQEVLRDGRPRLLEFGVADDVAFDVGLACGGHIELWAQPAGEVQDEAARLWRKGAQGLLRTDLKEGRQELVPGPPGFELARSGERWLEEPILPAPHLIIVGGIHIAIPLHRMAKVLGYRVSVVDARAKFASKDRFPEADAVEVGWPDDVLGGIEMGPSTAIVILTHDPKFDLPALRSALAGSAGYIGAIGSRVTNKARFEALREEGFSDQDLSRVHGPIGLDLGGRDAETTALGILGEIAVARFGGTGRAMRDLAGSAPAPPE